MRQQIWHPRRRIRLGAGGQSGNDVDRPATGCQHQPHLPDLSKVALDASQPRCRSSTTDVETDATPGTAAMAERLASIPATSSASIRMTRSIGPVTEWIIPIDGIA